MTHNRRNAKPATMANFFCGGIWTLLMMKQRVANGSNSVMMSNVAMARQAAPSAEHCPLMKIQGAFRLQSRAARRNDTRPRIPVTPKTMLVVRVCIFWTASRKMRNRVEILVAHSVAMYNKFAA